MRSDISDIVFLMRMMAADNDKIDFVGYSSSNVERLYTACEGVVNEWKQTKNEELIELMSSILEAEDRERMMG